MSNTADNIQITLAHKNLQPPPWKMDLTRRQAAWIYEESKKTPPGQIIMEVDEVTEKATIVNMPKHEDLVKSDMKAKNQKH